MADKIIFKGGTSLSKGNLIHRFSEDVDIFLDPCAYDPPLGKRAIDRALRSLRDAVMGHPALTLDALKNYDIVPVLWSHRDDVRQELAA